MSRDAMFFHDVVTFGSVGFEDSFAATTVENSAYCSSFRIGDKPPETRSAHFNPLLAMRHGEKDPCRNGSNPGRKVYGRPTRTRS
jgi:hypothetical protein